MQTILLAKFIQYVILLHCFAAIKASMMDSIRDYLFTFYTPTPFSSPPGQHTPTDTHAHAQHSDFNSNKICVKDSLLAHGQNFYKTSTGKLEDYVKQQSTDEILVYCMHLLLTAM